jgi:plastocyanin
MKRAVAIFLIIASLVAFVKAADVPVSVSNAAGDLTFTPAMVMANVGDNVVFTWAGTAKHSVIESDAAKSCVQSTKPAPFTSGGAFLAPKTFTYTPTAAGKQWFFCGVPGHCAAGMYGTLIVAGPGGAAPGGAPATPAANGTTPAPAPGGAMPSMPGGMPAGAASPTGSAPASTDTTAAKNAAAQNVNSFAVGVVLSSMCMAAAYML